ncbi:MAG: molybdopterin-dependent oxidoreductase [Bryobacteraceae bacterium]
MTRRRLFGTLGAGAGSLAGATVLADRYGLVPPDANGIWAPGHTLTFAAHRVFGANALAHEYRSDQITRPPHANGKPPSDEAFLRHKANGFADWRLEIGGLVERPRSFSVAEIKAMPSRSQVTSLACEEGWNYIAEWTGAPLAHVLDLVGMKSHARFVFYHSIQKNWWDSVDMVDALHPQTLVAYGFNGGDLPVEHGGPLRVRVPRQLGYKSVKFVTRLTVTDSLRDFGKGMGSQAAEHGYAWYSGI